MNKVIVIVGGSSGIGYALSRIFVKCGDRVYNCSRHPSPHPMVHNRKIDVVNLEEVENLVKDIGDKEGGVIDILIYSAGFSMAAPLEYVEKTDYKYLFDVNFLGAIEFNKQVIPFMKEKGGRIINISSVGGVVPIPYDPYYSASKAALNMFTECLNFELKNLNIKATSVMPGGTKTPFTFKRKIYTDKVEGYQHSLENSTKELHKVEQEGMEAHSVAFSIFKLLHMKNPPALYSTGTINKLTHFASRKLPKKLIYKLVAKKYRI